MGNKEVSGIYGYYDNLKDKIVYIGQSNKIYYRHTQHMRKSSYKIQHINKILQNNPKRYNLIVLKECEVDKLNYWEQTLITLFNPLFNFNDGGNGNRGFHHSDETKQKLREANLGKKHTLASRKKMSESRKGPKNHNYGKKFSEETRRKLSEAHKGENSKWYGKHHTEETRKKISEANKGRKHSKETLEKISKNNARHWLGKTGKEHPFYGRKHTEETKRKMSESTKLNPPFKGRHHTEETKRKLSEMRRGKKNPHYNEQLSDEGREVLRQNMLGSKNPNYNPYPHIIKRKRPNGKPSYSIQFHGKKILGSVNREFLEDYLDKYWDDIIAGKPTPKLRYKPKESPYIKKGARVVKAGYDNGKQRYQLIHNGKRLQCSVFKDKLQKLADEINAKT